jgi:circadian clock protein KaiB
MDEKHRETNDAQEALEQAADAAAAQQYVLRLFVAGLTPKSRLAIANIKKVCEENLRGRYDLEVIDLYQQPETAQEQQIIALPTLLKQLPLPLRRIIGDLSDREQVVRGLDLRPKP